MNRSETEHNQPVPDETQPAKNELPATHFSRDDDRWRWQNQLRDWLILLGMIAIYLIWTGVVYFLEPGIR